MYTGTSSTAKPSSNRHADMVVGQGSAHLVDSSRLCIFAESGLIGDRTGGMAIDFPEEQAWSRTSREPGFLYNAGSGFSHPDDLAPMNPSKRKE